MLRYVYMCQYIESMYCFVVMPHLTESKTLEIFYHDRQVTDVIRS